MSKNFKILAAVGSGFLLLGIGGLVIHRLRAWPELPHSPTPLGELIAQSDLIVHARVLKVEKAGEAVTATTNRWAVEAIKYFGFDKRPMTTARLEVLQTLKGGTVKDVVVDFPSGGSLPFELPAASRRWPKLPPASNANSNPMAVFLYRQRGSYHPVAYRYGARELRGKEGERLMRYIAELVATEKLSRVARERARAEWVVKLIEDPERRWDGAASWVAGGAKAGEALAKLPADLATRVEAVTFRDELLGQGDELLLREFAPAHRRKVVERLRRYFLDATRPARGDFEEFPEPWRCYGAMELLADVAGMSPAFKDGLAKGSYPDFSSSGKRRSFVENYLPAIEKRLRETGGLD